MRTDLSFEEGWQDRLNAEIVGPLGGSDVMTADKATTKRKRVNRLAVDLKSLHGPWAAWCERRGLTPSEAVRRVLNVVLNGNPSPDAAPYPADYDDVAGEGRHRVEIRIAEAEFLAGAATADREGLSVPKWLTALLRVHLTGEQMLGMSEVEALARSNQLLLALSRNINQIAYNMNQRAATDKLTLAQIEYVQTFLKSHVAEVAAVLHANSARWRR